MADGVFRYQQPGAGPFFSQHSNRSHNRATSPHGNRRPFATDTPSPSRSPAHPNMAHNYNLYSQNGFQNQTLMNSTQNHQRFSGLHMTHFQSKQHGHHGHMGQHHNTHHHNSHVNHQHNISSGTFQSTTPHLTTYGQDPLQNGTRDGGMGEELEENEYWQEQRRLCDEYSTMSAPHERARAVAQQSKGINFGGSLAGHLDEPGLEDRSRIITTSGQTRQVWSELDLGGQGLTAISPSLFAHYGFLTRLNLGHNRIRDLPGNIGKLKNLEFLDVSFNQLEYLPEEIGMLTNLKTLLLFGNPIESLNPELGYLFKLKTLGVYGVPMEEELKAKFTEGSSTGLIRYLLEAMPEPQPPREREWHQLEDRPADSNADVFKAMSYNILCQRYATPSMYGYVPERVLSWDYRKHLILGEIVNNSPDFVCLQELDRHSYDEFFRSELSIHGYKSYYAQKSRAETLGDNAKFVDGCGTFWKDKKYIMLDTQHFVLGRKAVARAGSKASADMLNRVWQRDDIATVVFLENRVTGSRVIVANAHVYWDPAFRDVKLIQVAVMFEELSELSTSYAKYPPSTNKQVFRFSDDDSEEPPTPGPSLEYPGGTQIPMIICGDFNSSMDSAVWDLFTKKTLEASHEDLMGRDYGSFSNSGMSHNFNLKSSYAAIDPDQAVLTNYTPDFQGSLDYIWYSSNSLRVTGVLGETDPEYLRKVPGFPNWHYPSDHIALLSEFRVEPQKKTQEKREVDFGPSSSKKH